MWARSASPPGAANAADSLEPYFASATCHPASREEPLEAVGGDAGDDTIEALAIEVHDHREVAEALGGRVGDGLPHVAFVELGIAHERDEPRRRLGGRSA